MAVGAFTSDNVDFEHLTVEMIRGVREYNERGGMDFLAYFSKPTTMDTVKNNERTRRVQRLGQDTARPEAEILDTQEITLTEPRRYGQQVEITRVAHDNNPWSADDIRDEFSNALDADHRLRVEWALSAMLTAGGFWNADATPPEWRANTFGGAHQHYLAYATSPTLVHCLRLRHLVEEHGYPGQVGLWMNSNDIEDVEGIVEWDTAPGPMPTSLLDELQKYGMTPAFKAGGMPIFIEDWVPENYGLCLPVGEKILRNKIPDNNDGSLEVHDHYLDGGMTHYYYKELTRYVACDVVKRSAGAAIYWGGGSWTDPTTFDEL